MCIFRSLTSSKLIWIARPVPEILHFSDSNDLERAKNKFVLALRAESPPTFLFFVSFWEFFLFGENKQRIFFPALRAEVASFFSFQLISVGINLEITPIKKSFFGQLGKLKPSKTNMFLKFDPSEPKHLLICFTKKNINMFETLFP